MRAMMLPIMLRHPWEPFLSANLDLDFATDHYYYNNSIFYNLAAFLAASGATFTRNASAYCEDSRGILTWFSPNIPRRSDKGVLIEEARTNIVVQCNDFTQAAWTRTAVTATNGTFVSPDGATDASTLAADGTSAYHNVNQSLAVTATQYTLSVYAAPSSASVLHMQVAGANIYAQFNLVDGSLLFSSAGTGTLTETGSVPSAPGGWRRYYMVFTQTSGSTQPIQICPLGTQQNAASPSESSSASIYIYGAQLEAGASMSSLIATVATAVTRPADVFSIPAAAFWNASGETILDVSQYVVVLAATAQVCNLWTLSDGTNNNRLATLKGISAATLGYRHVVGGTGSNPATSGSVLTKNVPFKAGYSASAANDFTSFNGVTVSTAVQTGMPPVTTLYVGQDQSGSYQNGYKSRLALFPVGATQDTLNALTAP